MQASQDMISHLSKWKHHHKYIENILGFTITEDVELNV